MKTLLSRQRCRCFLMPFWPMKSLCRFPCGSQVCGPCLLYVQSDCMSVSGLRPRLGFACLSNPCARNIRRVRALHVRGPDRAIRVPVPSLRTIRNSEDTTVCRPVPRTTGHRTTDQKRIRSPSTMDHRNSSHPNTTGHNSPGIFRNTKGPSTCF